MQNNRFSPVGMLTKKNCQFVSGSWNISKRILTKTALLQQDENKTFVINIIMNFITINNKLLNKL